MKIVNGQVVAPAISVDKAKSGIFLSWKDLKQFVDENKNLPDDVVVLIERVSDLYFLDETGQRCVKVKESEDSLELESNLDFLEELKNCDKTLIDVNVDKEKNRISYVTYIDGIVSTGAQVRTAKKENGEKENVVVLLANY